MPYIINDTEQICVFAHATLISQRKNETSTSVGTDLYPHMPILHNAHNLYPLTSEHAR